MFTGLIYFHQMQNTFPRMITQPRDFNSFYAHRMNLNTQIVQSAVLKVEGQL